MTKKTIRILEYIGNLNVGGSQTMIMELYRNIDRKKIQFDFIVDKKNDIFFKSEIEKLGGKVYFLPNYTGKNHFEYKKAWNDFFLEHKEYKIIHSHVRSTASIVLRIAKKHGLTTISHSHSTSNGKGFAALVKKFFQYQIRYVADYFVGCSKDSCVWLFGKKTSESSKCFVLNNSIHTAKYLYDENLRNEVRKKFNLDDKFVIGHVGRFIIPKNHDFLLDVFYELQKRQDNSFLLLVGDDSSKRHEIEKKIDSLGLNDKVLILSNRSDVNELLQAMDVFIMPSIYEGLPVTLIEAQASGIPIIMSQNITDEAIITNLVTKISLEESLEVWVQKILEQNKISRVNTKKEIVLSGYDINKNVKWLESFYQKLHRKSE